MLNYLVFITLQSLTVERIEKYFSQFNEKEKAIVWTALSDIIIQDDWKKVLELELNYKLWNISHFYKIPLLLNKYEMFQVYLYTEYWKFENKFDAENISFKNLTRKNYLWLHIIETPISTFDKKYIKLEKLSKKIKWLKNHPQLRVYFLK